jgi:hypothetical protein
MKSSEVTEPLVVRPLPDLTPGQRIESDLDVAEPPLTATLSIEMVRPDGSVMHGVSIIDRLTPLRKGSQ